MQVVFNNFMGGLNNQLRPSKISKNQAVVLDNVDISANTLRPLQKDQRVGENVPYQRVYFNQLIGTNTSITDMSFLVSQWGKYFSKDKIFYVNDENTISEAYYGIGAPTTAEFTTTVNEVNFDNISGLKGITYGVTEDADGNLISDLVIDGLTGEATTIYQAWEDEALVVYALDTDGTELTGKIREVINDKMPYILDDVKYAHEYADQNENYEAAGTGYSFVLHYEPILYNIVHTKEGVKQTVKWIDGNGNPIDIHKAILYNSIIVTSADENGISTGYARGNIVENIPFVLGATKYTMSTTAPAGYTVANDGETVWVNYVTYDDTDYDETDYHTYAVTLYNSLTGQETPPVYGTTTEVHPAQLGTKIVVTFNPDPEGVLDDFTVARVYRVSGPYKTYRFVTEVDVLTAGESKYIEMNKYITNDQLTYACETVDYVGKPTLQGIVGHANRIFGYNGNTLYYTLTDNPYSWSEFASIFVEGAIQAIQTTSAGLLILTKAYKAYIVTGTNPNTFVLRKIAENVGYTEGMIGVKGNAYWIYNNNVYVSNGSVIQNITEDKFELPNESIVDINVVNEDIYLVYTNNIYKFHNNAIVNLVIPDVIDTQVIDGQLRYFANGFEYILEGSTVPATWKYVSPDIYATTIVDVKEFNEVEIAYEGKVTAKFYIDKTLIHETSLSADTLTIETIKLPADSNDGHILSIEFSGTGEVYEYKIEVGNVGVE